MESPNSDQQAGLKRKRSPVPGGVAEEGRPTPAGGGAGAAPKGIGNVPQINYLVKAKSERLRLIEGDSETFGDVLGMIDDYEGMFLVAVTGSGCWRKSFLGWEHRMFMLLSMSQFLWLGYHVLY
jgi:hypothetical protein